MNKISGFLFTNVPLAIVHFVCFILARREGWTIIRKILGQPGFWAARILGASYGGILFWAVMVVNSLLWAAVLTLIVYPCFRKILK